MTREFFKRANYTADGSDMVEYAVQIVKLYTDQGYDLTLRQVYYQFVARDYFPESRRWTWTGTKWVKDQKGTKNAQPNYKWLGRLLSNARLSGHLDWDVMVDRTRNLERNAHWDDAEDAIHAMRDQFRIDLWNNQPRRVEVWIEKEALINVIEETCESWDVPYLACRGYMSQSEMWRAYRRSLDHELVILHLGDHDPSGVDMSRDNEDRLVELFGGSVELHRLALNMNQIEELNPPPSPAKITDSRAKKYIERFGNDSWELDALEPAMINELIETNIHAHIERGAWEEATERQEEHRKRLTSAIDFVSTDDNDLTAEDQ